MSINLNSNENIFKVSQLNNLVRNLLEDSLPPLLIEGEISNLSKPTSGHYYFSLKDDQAQIRCAFFRNRHHHLNINLENGQHILMKAQVSLYEPRGDYQLIVEYIELAGEGLLRKKFELLKQKLDKEGLFDPKHKKPLPEIPQRIGIITSATGAALHDILHVLNRRAAAIPVIIYPTLVQGDTAVPQIIRAIEIANQRDECDVIILARGGGSIEDLWCFNDEGVARAIFASKIPIITGIGHEVDFTIADFVADIRAPTPSAAAELISPDYELFNLTLLKSQQRLFDNMLRILQQRKEHIHYLSKRLRHPSQRILDWMQRLDHCEEKLMLFMQKQLQHKQQQLQNYCIQLNAYNPLKTIARGYSILYDQKTGKIIRTPDNTKIGAMIINKLTKGEIVSEVCEIRTENN